MALKKLLGAALALIMLIPVFDNSALADGGERLEVEQYEIRMPEIDVYFHPLAADATEIKDFASSVTDMKAVLGSKTLTVNSLERYSGGTTYYFLVDISGSIPSDTFKSIKASMSSFIGAMSQEDAVVLITFGENVTTLLDGTQSRSEALATIEAMQAKDNITRFFDAVSTAVSLAESASSVLPSRRVALLFTDGKDVSEAGGTTAAEMQQSLIDAGLPMYALGIGSNKTYLDALGEFSRSTGGYYASINASGCEATLLSVKERIDSCYVLHLTADSNIIDAAQEQLIIKLTSNGKELTVTTNVSITDWIPDTEAPYVEKVYISGKNELSLVFSEAVTGADAAANYSVSTNGGALEVRSASYDDAAHAVRLSFAQTLYTGDYEISFINIADRSMEKNALRESSVSGTGLVGEPLPTPEATQDDTSAGIADEAEASSFPVWLAAVLAVCVIGGAVVVIIIVTSKKKQDEGETGADSTAADQYAMNVPASTNVRVPGAIGTRCQAVILDASGVQRRVDFTAVGAYTVGRSQSSADMAVDDKQLSRMHFRLTCENGCLFIEDLGSTNGTEVNGVPIASRRPIRPDDVITAGNSKFKFTII